MEGPKIRNGIELIVERPGQKIVEKKAEKTTDTPENRTKKKKKPDTEREGTSSWFKSLFSRPKEKDQSKEKRKKRFSFLKNLSKKRNPKQASDDNEFISRLRKSSTVTERERILKEIKESLPKKVKSLKPDEFKAKIKFLREVSDIIKDSDDQQKELSKLRRNLIIDRWVYIAKALPENKKVDYIKAIIGTIGEATEAEKVKNKYEAVIRLLSRHKEFSTITDTDNNVRSALRKLELNLIIDRGFFTFKELQEGENFTEEQKKAHIEELIEEIVKIGGKHEAQKAKNRYIALTKLLSRCNDADLNRELLGYREKLFQSYLNTNLVKKDIKEEDAVVIRTASKLRLSFEEEVEKLKETGRNLDVNLGNNNLSLLEQLEKTADKHFTINSKANPKEKQKLEDKIQGLLKNKTKKIGDNLDQKLEFLSIVANISNHKVIDEEIAYRVNRLLQKEIDKKPDLKTKLDFLTTQYDKSHQITITDEIRNTILDVIKAELNKNPLGSIEFLNASQKDNSHETIKGAIDSIISSIEMQLSQAVDLRQMSTLGVKSVSTPSTREVPKTAPAPPKIQAAARR